LAKTSEVTITSGVVRESYRVGQVGLWYIELANSIGTVSYSSCKVEINNLFFLGA